MLKIILVVALNSQSRYFNCRRDRYLQILVDLQLTAVRSEKIVNLLIIDFHVGDTDEVFSVYRLRHRSTPSNAIGLRANASGIIVHSVKHCEASSEMESGASASHLLDVTEDFTHG